MSRLAFRGPFLLMYAIDQQLGALLTHAMRDAPLRPGEFAIYSTLRLEQPTTPSVLARTLGMRPTTLSSHLAKMAERDHLTRAPNPDDGRSWLVSLTTAGMHATEACFPPFAAALAAFEDALLAGRRVDQQTLLDHLEAASAALDEAAVRLDRSGASEPDA